MEWQSQSVLLVCLIGVSLVGVVGIQLLHMASGDRPDCLGRRHHRSEVGTILAGALFPATAPLLITTGGPLRFSPVVVALGLGSALLIAVWGLFRGRQSNRVSAARERLFEAMSDAVLVLDGQDRVLDLNPAARRLLGRAEAEITGKSISEVCSKWPRLAKLMRDVDEGPAEVAIDHEDGQLNFELSFLPLDNDPERSSGRVVVLRDITLAKRAEETLREKERRLWESREVLEAVTKGTEVIVAAQDAEFRYVFFNEAYRDEIRRLTGKELHLGDSMVEAFAHMPDQQASALKQWSQTLRGESTSFRRESGDAGRPRRVYDVRRTPLRDAQGNVTGAGEVGFDVTEQVQVEEALRESEERFRTIYDTAPVSIWQEDWSEVIEAVEGLRAKGVTDFAGYFQQHPGFVADMLEAVKILDVNQWTVDMFGARHKEEILASLGTIFASPDTLSGFVAELTALAEGKRVFRTEMAVNTVQGGTLHILLAMTFPPRGSTSGQVLVSTIDITARKRAEEALFSSEQHYRRLFDTMLQGVVYQDAEGQIASMNPAAERILGKTPDEFLGQSSVSVEHDTLREDGSPFPGVEHPAMVALRTGREVRNVVMAVYNPREQRHRWITITAVPLVRPGEDKPYQVYTIFDDITERQERDKELRRLNRTLTAHGHSDQALLRATTEAEYLRRVCQIIVEDCGHAMVWIGLTENDELKTIRPVASAGFEEGYLETLHLTWADSKYGRGPAGMAVRRGEPCLCRNMLTDPQFEPWREEALARGYASSLALPLLDGAQAFGVLAIYFEQPDPFTEDEVTLLVGLADDLAYGIRMLRLRDAHAQAEQALRKSEEQYRELFTSMTEGFALHEILCDADGAAYDYRYLEVNPAFEKLSGLRREQLIGRTALEVLPDTEPFWIETYGRVALTGKPIHFERYSRATGRYYEVLSFRPAEGQSAALFLDVTARKEAEAALQRAHDELDARVRERTEQLQQTNIQLRAEIEERTRTEQSLRLEEARLDTLLRLSEMSEASISELAGFVLDQGIALTQSKIGFVGFLSEDESVYTLHAVSKDVVKECDVAGAPLQWHIAEAGVWADAIRERRTLFINDYSQPHPRKRGLPAGHPQVQRFMVVPILDSGRVVAVAGVGNKGADYDSSDQRHISLLLEGMWNWDQRNRAREALQETHDELQASEERFRQLAENIREVFWMLEPETRRLLYVSPAYDVIWGRSRQELYDQPVSFLDTVYPEDREALVRGFTHNWRAYDGEFRIQRPDGTLRWIQIRSFPVHNEQGEVYRLAGIAADRTEQKAAEAALFHAERLTIAGKMAASLAHEINNPLQAVVGCLGLARGALEKDQDAGGYLQIAHQEVQRTTRIVSQLRSLGRPAEDSRKVPTDLNRLVSDVLVLNKKHFQTHNIDVLWEPGPDLPMLTVVPDAIRQVFLNLILNAVDAMPEGGQLRLSTACSEAPAGVQVVLADSGIGIAPEVLPHLFEAFYSTKPDGLGVGLFVSQSIVQQHSGRMEVESQPGAGTTFTIWLPEL